MPDRNTAIPDTTIETLARSFFKQSANYGFQREDYLKFVNALLDFAMSNGHKLGKLQKAGQEFKDHFGRLGRNNFSQLPLCTERVRIRVFQPKSDRNIMERWLDDDHGRYFLLSRTTARELNLDQLIKNDYNILGWVTLADNTPVGVVAFLDHDPIQKKAELRKLIGNPSMRGKGLAKEATRLWIHYGKEGPLGLQKIYLNTLNTNIRNIRLNEELGFKVEGILRNETFIDGKYYDVLRMGMWNGVPKNSNP